MKFRILVLFTFFYSFTIAKNNFSAGFNFAVERISWNFPAANKYNDGFYNPMNIKLGIEANYIRPIYGIGLGVTKFDEDYNLRQFYNSDQYPISFSSINIGFTIRTYLNFSRGKNTFFLSVIDEIIYCTSATKIAYGTPSSGTEYLYLNNAQFNRNIIEMGIGFKLNLIEKMFFKILPYYSFNTSSTPILGVTPEFNKTGIDIGLLREF